jgi:hypothetical protein
LNSRPAGVDVSNSKTALAAAATAGARSDEQLLLLSRMMNSFCCLLAMVSRSSQPKLPLSEFSNNDISRCGQLLLPRPMVWLLLAQANTLASFRLFGTDPNRIGLLGKPPAVKHSFPSKSRQEYSLPTFPTRKCMYEANKCG